MLILISLGTLVCTFMGGLFAIRFQDRLHLILGFSAGAVLGVAFFDLMPEALETGGEIFGIADILGIIACGFLFYMVLDRTLGFHEHGNSGSQPCRHVSPVTKRRGFLGAGSLCFHSFLDGIAIGVAFQSSIAVGVVVAVAVLVHDFSDGINTVNMVLKNGGRKKDAFKWLAVDAIAPALGVASTLLIDIPEKNLSLLLATFCGFFLYIGASDLLPESYHRHSTLWTTLSTLLGAAVMYIAIQLATP